MGVDVFQHGGPSARVESAPSPPAWSRADESGGADRPTCSRFWPCRTDSTPIGLDLACSKETARSRRGLERPHREPDDGVSRQVE
jgi:hypothetical protein